MASSQESDKIIYKNAQGNWELDQQTAEANYYAIQERDSLIAENERLRKRIKVVEAEKKELIEITLASLNNSDRQIANNENATNNVNETNEEIINVWRKISKGIHLNALGTTDLRNNYTFSLLLSAPLDFNWSVIGLGSTSIQGEPFYSIGLSYSIV